MDETPWAVTLNMLTVVTGLIEGEARVYAADLVRQASVRAYPMPGAWRDKADQAITAITTGALDWAKVSRWFITVHPVPEFTIRPVQLESAK
jgi:hypothetical protein